MIRPATLRQREYVSALIVRGVTADEVSRLIATLEREQERTKGLLAEIIEANRVGDRKHLGALLVELKGRTVHGEWVDTLQELEISPRRAQRAMKRARQNGQA